MRQSYGYDNLCPTAILVVYWWDIMRTLAPSTQRRWCSVGCQFSGTARLRLQDRAATLDVVMCLSTGRLRFLTVTQPELTDHMLLRPDDKADTDSIFVNPKRGHENSKANQETLGTILLLHKHVSKHIFCNGCQRWSFSFVL